MSTSSMSSFIFISVLTLVNISLLTLLYDIDQFFGASLEFLPFSDQKLRFSLLTC